MALAGGKAITQQWLWFDGGNDDSVTGASLAEALSAVSLQPDRRLDLLRRSCEPQSQLLPISRRPSRDFQPPASLAVPIIMVGPGTGVAPFIGFLEQREQQYLEAKSCDSVGEAWLFHGCRHREHDYLFRCGVERRNEGA